MFRKYDMRIWNIDKFWKIVYLVGKRNYLFSDKYSSTVFVPRIVCKDGYSVSVQAGSTMYSMPREDGLEKYEEYELGYPTKRDKILKDYEEGWYDEGEIDYTKMVYAYVPVKIVNKLIKKHGGIVDVEWKF